MTRRSLLAVPLALGAQDSPTIRVEVQLIRVLANVKDQSNQLVGGLSKEDFEIFDNGVPQQISIFERSTNQPLNVAVLLDISASVAKDLRYETESSLGFARSLINEGNPDDIIALITFNHAVDLVAGFTRRIRRLENAMRDVRTGSGTALYDAVYLAGEELEGREGRKVMICVTDGGDTASRLKFNDAMLAAQRAQASLYAILVTPILNNAGRNQGGENALQLMAERTGGRVLQPTTYAKLGESFDAILRDLRTQYLLAYYPRNLSPTKDKFHRLEVRMRPPGLRVSARTGYYEETL
ncbi:VWA domain-containing protein [Bryobacter aggregatus]|uniref:VWA domain-containing protein n=1 Tax=Bryobacter aggregatus TaxID=360054 RepID=UPI0004E191DB|nr:VWA domain-containing protein [Bryobacter aggregatus]